MSCYYTEAEKYHTQIQQKTNEVGQIEKPPVISTYKEPSFLKTISAHLISSAIVGVLSFFAADKDIVVRAIKAFNPEPLYSYVITSNTCNKCSQPKVWLEQIKTNVIYTVDNNYAATNYTSTTNILTIKITNTWPTNTIRLTNTWTHIKIP